MELSEVSYYCDVLLLYVYYNIIDSNYMRKK